LRAKLNAKYQHIDKSSKLVQAMQNIMMNTCIQYRPMVIGADKDWMEFQKAGAMGCSANPAQ
jgi:hypothetical protein